MSQTSFWRVGTANNPQDDDVDYDDEEEALNEARNMADEDFNLPVAVWDEKCDIVHLFLCGQYFKAV